MNLLSDFVGSLFSGGKDPKEEAKKKRSSDPLFRVLSEEDLECFLCFTLSNFRFYQIYTSHRGHLVKECL